MGWPNSGVWAQDYFPFIGLVEVSSNWLAEIIEALCRAVNERRVATGGSTTNFYYSDDLADVTAYPTAAQFRANLVQDDGPCVLANLEKLQDEVTAMAASGDFYEDDTFAAAWTAESLLIDVGMGEFDPEPATALFVGEWLKLRECLDRLIYTDTTIDTGLPGEVLISGSAFSSFLDTYTTVQDAWDHRTDQSGETLTVQWVCQGSVETGGSPYYAAVFRSSEGSFSTSSIGYSVTILSAIYTYHTHKTFSMPSINVEINGYGFTISAAGVGFVDITANASLTADTTVSTEITSSEPSDAPSSGGAPPVSVGLNPVNLHLYIDLSSALTDQA